MNQNKIWKICVFVFCLLSFGNSSGTSVLSLEQAEIVQKLIRSNSILVHYCPECKNEFVEIWHLKKILVNLKEDTKIQYSLQAFGTKLYRSQKPLAVGESDASLFFRSFPADELNESFLIQLDLNHIYIPSENYQNFLLLSDVMEIASTNKRTQFNLPKELVDFIKKQIK